MRAPAHALPSTPAPPLTRGVRLLFAPDVPLDEVAATLELSLFATRSIYGGDAVAIDTGSSIDADDRTVTVDTSSKAGRTLALVFLGYVRREFGDAAVRVFRVRGGAQ